MSSKRILLLFGTRPEAIKMCPLVHAVDRQPGLQPVVVVTGQHARMLDQVLDLFGVTPDADLQIHSPGQTLTGITTRILSALPDLLERLSPDVVVVQGDTTSAFAAALAAAYARLPLVHLEAGLRSGTRAAPFPEEINRRLTSQLSTLHLAATAANRNTLLAEGIPANEIAVTGNTVIDALLSTAAHPRPFTDPALQEIPDTGRLVLVTAHRRESWGRPLHDIACAIADIAAAHPDTTFVWPLHPNPLVRDCVLPAVRPRPNVRTTEPLNYPDFTRLLARAHLAVTDSGGVQEEAPALGVPVLVTRDVTERTEVIACGAGRLVGTDPSAIRTAVETLLTDPSAHARMRVGRSPYGDGQAAARAAAAISALTGLGHRLPDFAPVPVSAAC